MPTNKELQLVRSDGPERATAMRFILRHVPAARFQTDPRILFAALGPKAVLLDWVLADLVCNYFPPEIRVTREPQLISGATLANVFAREADNLQFIWGVLIALPPGSTTAESCRHLDVYADGYTDIFDDPPRRQHPESLIEVVCWDATETVILSFERAVSEHVREFLERR